MQGTYTGSYGNTGLIFLRLDKNQTVYVKATAALPPYTANALNTIWLASRDRTSQSLLKKTAYTPQEQEILIPVFMLTSGTLWLAITI